MRKVTSITILIIIIVVAVTQFSSLAGTVNAAGGNDPELEAVAAILNEIESGRNALVEMERYAVEVKFEMGGGTHYLASKNWAVIDGSQGAQLAALNFIHEMNHARYHSEGLRVDIGGTDQEFYIKGRIEEEAEGLVRSIEAKKELAAAGLDVSQVRYPLEKAYTQAYQKAQNAARVRERGITPAELDHIGQVAGTARVIQGLVNGEVLGSTSLLPYTEVYGDCWSTADTLAGLVTIVGMVISAEAAAELLQSINDYVSGTC
jgi:hypothetical protein